MKISCLFVLIPFIVGGCATYAPVHISAGETVADFKSRNLQSPDLKGFLEANLRERITPWPVHSWGFNMLMLAALYYHPELKVARAKWEVSEAGIITAGQRPNPSFSFLPQFVSNAAGGESPWVLPPTLDIPIETAGKRRYRVERAFHLSEWARQDMYATIWLIRGRLRQNLLDFYMSLESEKGLHEQFELRRETVKMLAQRLEYGYISLPVLTQARIALDQSQIASQDAQRQTAEARVKVAQSLGIPVNALTGIDISFSFLSDLPEHLNIEEIRRRALLRRPDILAALSRFEAAQSALQLQIAGQYPDITLGPGYEYDQGQNKWGIGFAIELPILNRNEGPIAEAEAKRKEIAAEFVSLQAGIIGSIDQALIGYEKALRTLEVADSLLASEKKQVKSVRTAVERGEEDNLALLSARLILSSVGLSRLKAFYNAQQALGALENATYLALTSTATAQPTPKTNTRDEGMKAQ
jgi:cobalt-zinc-cadmium efflux system outer membrane protein